MDLRLIPDIPSLTKHVYIAESETFPNDSILQLTSDASNLPTLITPVKGLPLQQLRTFPSAMFSEQSDLLFLQSQWVYGGPESVQQAAGESTVCNVIAQRSVSP